jgi:hypothetical protein
MNKQTLTFTRDRETARTVRYVEEVSGKPPLIGIIYIEKSALGNEPPRKLIITLGQAQE